jgi:integrase
MSEIDRAPESVEARETIEAWRRDYNEVQPHTALGNRTPQEFTGAAPAVHKELLRHANIQTTMNIYTQAVTTAKREAASKVVDILWRM